MRTTIFVLVLSTVLSLRAQTPRHLGPLLEFPIKGWDFGSVIQGTHKKKTLRLTNKGDADLIIQLAKVTCGCLSVTVTKKKIPPGESASLVVSLDSNRQRGRIKKHIIVTSNSRQHGQVFIPVFGEIKPVYRLEHDNLDFGLVIAGKTAKVEMKVFALPGAHPKVGTISLRHEALKITTRVFAEENGTHGLIITAILKQTAKPGRLVVPVRINLLEDKVDALRFVVVGAVLGDIRISPTKLSLPAIKSSKTREITVELSSFGKTPFRVERASCIDPHVTVEKDSESAQEKHTMIVKIAPAGFVGFIRTRIYLVTNRADQRVFTIPLQVEVRR